MLVICCIFSLYRCYFFFLNLSTEAVSHWIGSGNHFYTEIVGSIFNPHEVLEMYAMSMLCASVVRCVHETSTD